MQGFVFVKKQIVFWRYFLFLFSEKRIASILHILYNERMVFWSESFVRAVEWMFATK